MASRLENSLSSGKSGVQIAFVNNLHFYFSTHPLFNILYISEIVRVPSHWMPINLSTMWNGLISSKFQKNLALVQTSQIRWACCIYLPLLQFSPTPRCHNLLAFKEELDNDVSRVHSFLTGIALCSCSDIAGITRNDVEHKVLLCDSTMS